MSTKEKILHESLKLFSQYGYSAVGVEQIATAVGIRAPSLYKHYKSKQEIFDAIFMEMQKRYDAQTEKMQVHIKDGATDAKKFARVNAEELSKELKKIIYFSIHDEYTALFRKLLTIEQFHSPQLSALYNERYVNRYVHYHEKLFEELMAIGAICKGDAHSLALMYTAPVLVLLSVCDRTPEEEDHIMEELKAHVKQFWALTQPNK